MRIARIRVAGFMSYDHADVELPEGLTVVTGANGEGKSALPEAVSVAFWGRTMRGTPFWRDGELCEATSVAGDVVATRKVTKGGSKSLRWALRGEDGVFATPSKAQAELDEHIPPFDTWRRCCVISSHDAALFSVATDASRKQLLESLLGVSRFDAALKCCRVDLSAASVRENRVITKLESVKQLVEEKRRRLHEAREGLETVRKPKHPGRLKGREASMSTTLEGLRDRTGGVDQELREARIGGAESSAEVRQLRAQLELIGDGRCPTCGQGVGEDVIAPLQEVISKGEAEVAQIQERRAEQVDQLTVRLKELNAEASELSAEIVAIRNELRTNDRDRETRDHFKVVLDSAEKEIAEAEAAIGLANEEARSALVELAELRVVEDVLGLRGVRAHVLGRALDGLEAIAAGYVRRLIGPGVELLLRPYKSLKGGGTSDEVSLELSGVGGGYGYKANSGGQRRCVDISLLLGLANISDAARGAEPGTVWFDEVFDALDQERVGAVSEIVREMSAQRPVVVISHNPALVEDLLPEAELHLHVQGHKITARAT